MKYFLFISAFACFATEVIAQKPTFGVVSYSAPKGWQQQENEGGVQLSVSDKKTGDYALFIITKATASEAGANENFNTDWTRLVKATVPVDANPTMLTPTRINGWDIISGNANYMEGGKKGQATLLTATGAGQMVSVVIMTNTQHYQNELTEIINSLDLTKLPFKDTQVSASNEKVNNTQLAGLWANYILETNGYINGLPQYTAGYSRSEYLFKEDGTYIFRTKNWMVYGAKDILFVYETGTYSANGSQITLTPNQVKAGWWAKKSSTKEWGPFIKGAADYKLVKKVFNYEIKYNSGYHATVLLLKTGQKAGVQEYSYSYRANKESLIDNPPGFKTGVENESSSEATKKAPSLAMHSPLTGKIWEGTTTEKFSNAGGTNYNTGGFTTYQYQFNTDGTYRFVSVVASHFTDTKSLQYETGTYTLNANHLTIKPAKGINEKWSKIGKTANGNSDVTNRAINDTWGNRLKTSSRKLEQVTYTFSFNNNGDRNVLILEYGNRHTERGGSGRQTYLNETTLENAVKLPKK